jgi:hypothetical protein
MAVHQCPFCELRFLSNSEVEWHLLEDHHDRALTAHSAAAALGSARSLPRTRGS